MSQTVEIAVVEAFGLRTRRLREICERHYEPDESWQRIVDLSEAIRGLTLSGLPPRIEKGLNRLLVQVNGIFEKYPIETVEDYQKISAEDLERIRKIFLQLCELAPPRYRNG